MKFPLNPQEKKMSVKRFGLRAALVLSAVVLAISGAGGFGDQQTKPKVSHKTRPEIRVMISGGLTAVYIEIARRFERETPNTLWTAFGPSMGTAPNAIPVRLKRGEHADVVIMVGDALDKLIQRKRVVPGSRVDLASSRIGMAVKAGAKKPDISTIEAFRKTLLNAKSIAISDSASGRYISGKLLPDLRIWDAVKDRCKRIKSVPVGAVVASGDAEIGFQQISELLPIAGIEFVGPIPEELQKVTVFSAGITTTAKRPEAAKALVRYLSQKGNAVIKRNGMEPVVPRGKR